MMKAVAGLFPDILADYRTDELLEVYAAGPARLRRVLKGLSPADQQARPNPGKWSAQEIALHLADGEIVGAARMRWALAEPGIAITMYDQDRWANALAYRTAQPAEVERSLSLFEVLRRCNSALLARATEGEWGNSVMHPTWGTITLRNLLELYAEHGERHVSQIVALRDLLGRPLDLPPLLDRWLY